MPYASQTVRLRGLDWMGGVEIHASFFRSSCLFSVDRSNGQAGWLRWRGVVPDHRLIAV